jgi:carbonic anhydrase
MSKYDEIFENNRRWVEESTKSDPDFFRRLATSQNPDFLFIGCSDSRVPANQIMGLDPGQVFVHRNVANLVVGTDINAQSVIEYAVGTLDVEHIVVCGHYGCGGVAAAMQPADLGLLNGWLREIRDVYRMYQDELDAIKEQDARYRRLIELNIQEQGVHLIKTAVVQKTYLRTGHPRVHGWVYDVSNGLLRDLEIPFDEILGKIQKIYDLGAQ